MKETDETITETELDELIDELQGEVDLVEEPKTTSNNNTTTTSFWKNLQRSWYRKPKTTMAMRFQKLAGIVDNKIVAVLTLPSGQRVEFKELPSWKDVIRYKICGFKYETF